MKIAFLSYAHANDKLRDSKILSLIAKVEGEIRERLGSDAFSIFVDRNDIRYAQEWQRRIDSGLMEAAVLIPVISPHYLNSLACQQEYNLFAAKEKEFLIGHYGDRSDRLILPLHLLPASSDQQQHPIWLDVKQIQWCAEIDELTRPYARKNSKDVDHFVRKIAARLLELYALTRNLGLTQGTAKKPAALHTTKELVANLREFSRPLTEWPSTLPNDVWLAREQLSDLRQRISSQRSTTLFLVGPPGSGKSSILAHLSSDLTKEGVTVLGIKADQLPKQLNSLEDLSRLIFTGEDERTRNLVEELRLLAVHQAVVILIDQLDALANLADLESARLNVILELIGQLRDRGAIHIVASMRTYELSTDQRLRGLLEEHDAEPDTIELNLLALTQVQQTLTAIGVTFEHWPSDILEFLRVPYHLNVFLQHLELFLPTDRGRIPDATLFSSIQSMHAAKFNFTIGRSAHSGSLEEAVSALVERVERTESLWQAREDFQTELLSHLHELESLGWVRFQDDQVGFAHQTQYEFLLGRRFVADPKAFVQYVGERKTGLFVRPTVWHTLALLRSVAQANYAVAMSQLLAGSLPRHLRRLLMEFLSEVNQPTPSEISWVSAYLRKADTCITMCWLLRGKSEWFNSIPDDTYEHLMHHGGEGASWAVTRLLESSWSADTNRVTQLVQQHWAFKVEFATHVWWVVASAPHFSDELITWLHFCVDISAEDNHWFLHKSIECLNEQNPEASYRLIAKILDRRLDLAIDDSCRAMLSSIAGQNLTNQRHGLLRHEA
ncbi:MAG: TIR domain-containing protein [Planctomycetaceae bacterium]